MAGWSRARRRSPLAQRSSGPELEPVSSDPVVPWTCPTCATPGTTPFCAQCGEERRSPGDLSLRHYLATAAESLFSWDGRILGTLTSFVRRPGELSVAYLEGRRKPFLNPLQLFLLINVLFFVQQGVTGWNTYSTPWHVHVRDSIYADAAQVVARWRLDQLGLPYTGDPLWAYVSRFNAAVQLSAKSLLVLLIPFVTVLVVAVRAGRPRQAAAHLTVGLHLTAYLLALQTLVLPVVTLIQWVAYSRGYTLDRGVVDFVATWTLNVAIGVISTVVIQRVFGTARRWAIVQGVGIGFFHVYAIQCYRILLFLITLFTTS